MPRIDHDRSPEAKRNDPKHPTAPGELPRLPRDDSQRDDPQKPDRRNGSSWWVAHVVRVTPRRYKEA